MFQCCGVLMAKNGFTKGGNQKYRCKVCKKTKVDSPPRLSREEYQRQWREENPDKVSQWQKDYFKRHPEKYEEKKKKETERQRLARQAKKAIITN